MSKPTVSALEKSPLEVERMSYLPRMPPLLRGAFQLKRGAATTALKDADKIESIFPNLYGQRLVDIVPNKGGPASVGACLKIGVVLSGGPAPGGHNVILGLYEHLRFLNTDSKLIGFLGGPKGILENKYVELDDAIVEKFRNTGGFYMIGSGRDKIETVDDFEKVRQTVEGLELDGLAVVGGDDSNSFAMYLAEYFVSKTVKCKIIGVPKTIDGDFRNIHLETSFGFDTAVKVYSELIANLGFDAISAKKSYHFCRLMGRSASHISLECALQTHPNMVIIGEECAKNNWTLKDVTNQLADLICERAALGKNYGLIIVPEGLIKFMPDMKDLLLEVDKVLLDLTSPTIDSVTERLSENSKDLYLKLPEALQEQIILERDPNGKMALSQTETERLLISFVTEELKLRKQKGSYVGKFFAIPHFFGYEGRCAFPTNFDCNYCYTLGHTAATLIEAGCTGYMAVVKNLQATPEKWQCGGIPITSMMHMVNRKGKEAAAIKKAWVDLDGLAFKIYKEQRNDWRLSEDYRCPGPIQHGGSAIADSVTFTLMSASAPIQH